MFDLKDLTKGDLLEKGEIPPNNVTQLNCVAYLQKILKKQLAGELKSFTVVALTTEGKISMWVPSGMMEQVEDFKPIISALKFSVENVSSSLN